MKLIFFDIDGTLMTENGTKTIPDSTLKALDDLKKKGNLIFINSGRTMSEIENEIKEPGFDGFVCGCGTYIEYRGKEVFSRQLMQNTADEITKDLEKYKLEWLLEGKNKLYYSSNDYSTHIGDFKGQHTQLVPDTTFIVPPASEGLEFDKLCVCIDEKSDFEGFKGKYEDIFEFIDRGGSFFEIVPRGSSKAEGIRFLMDYLGVSIEDTVSIGDSTNDLPMLEFTGISIGMGGCCEQVAAAVDYVTDNIEDDGLYNAFKHFKLI